MESYVSSLQFLQSHQLIFSRLTASEQRELQSRMEKKQMKEFMNVGLAKSNVVNPLSNCPADLLPDVLESRSAMLRSLRQWL